MGARYPNITVEELFYLIACRIEGENLLFPRNYSTGNTKRDCYGGDRLGKPNSNNKQPDYIFASNFH